MAWKSALVRVPLARKLVVPRPTPEDVREFWGYMTARHGVRVVDKASATEMQIVGELLDLLGITSKKDFLEKYTTVIPISPVRMIYIPFEIGVEKPGWSLWGQMRICAHEIDHVIQCRRAGDLGYGWDYITSTAWRAHYEAEAYRSGMELDIRYFGSYADPAKTAEKLKHYGCTSLDIDVARNMMLLALPTVKAGGIVEPATKEAVIWLDERYGWAA